jgi:DNA-binding transcriptional ArsR family regulator
MPLNGGLEPVTDAPETRTRLNDPKVMRALAHPARITILTEMSTGRSGTATEFAALCGLTPSATSYHLRALARAGMVEEAPGRGDGRERVWRAVRPGGYQLDPAPGEDLETSRARQELVGAFMSWDEARARGWLARMNDEPKEWDDAAALSHAILVLTPDELTRLVKQVDELHRPYSRLRRTDPPSGAREISMTYRAYPLPGVAPDQA